MRPRTAHLAVILALGILMAPLATQAQQPGRVPRIGFLSLGSPSGSSRYFEAFRQALRDLWYLEETHIGITPRWAEGRAERLPDFAAELVRLKVDVIVTQTTPAAQAARDATR